MPYGRISYIER